ncbi:MAG: type IV toxin-antitoxin system AbiEi family antitoxin [Micromonosporaceae bacterium]
MDDMIACFESCLNTFEIRARFSTTTAASPRTQQAKVRLARRGSAQDYTLLYDPTVTFADVVKANDADLPVLVFTTYTSSRTTDTFRRAGVQYLDTAGNAWITFGDVLVDVRGRPRPDRATTPRRIAGNLFSAGRAQVVFALLAWPHLRNARRRDVAFAAGVSVGQAHNALTLLAEAGYDSDLIRPGQTPLLELWAAAFPTGLAVRLTLATFQGNIDGLKVAKPDDVAFVSGEKAASDLLRPTALTLYVENLDPRLPIINRWRTDAKPNIVVRRAFWHAPDDDAPRTGLAIAPWPLVYADLLASPDPRVRGAAQEWKDRNAQPA